MKEENIEQVPFVTVIIVTRNEEKYIEQCLSSFLKQDYPKERYEILLVDGESSDNTVNLAKTIVEEHYKETQSNFPTVSILNNEKRILASGWNIGIRQAKGNFVTRIDAHGYPKEDFISASVGTMLKIGDAVCVGGRVISRAKGKMGVLISKILSSSFGVGNSCFRVSNKAHYSDTVAFGLYEKSVFSKIGYFDESLKRNQDNDLHARIKQIGGKFYFNPSIKSIYYTRESIRAMLFQGYQNGKWNVVVYRRNKNSLSFRHIIPFLFVLGIISSTLLGFLYTAFWYILISVLMVHFFLGLGFAFRSKVKFWELLIMPWLFLALHVSYGMGSLCGVLHQARGSINEH